MNTRLRQFFFLGVLLTMTMSMVIGQELPQDCDLEFEYEVEQPANDQDTGKIYLIYLNGNGPFTIRIYDTMAGIHEFKETKVIERFSRNSKVLVFDNLEPSNYMIRIENEKCKRSLTGIEGITIK